MNAAVLAEHPASPAAMLLPRLETELSALCGRRSRHGLDRAREAARRHLASGGQRLRARLCLDTALTCDLASDAAVQLALACELAHNASLVHDDICDGAPYRRGEPSVWARHGTPGALCTGDWLLAAAYGALGGRLPGATVPALLARLTWRLQQTIEGQMAEAAAADGGHTLAGYARIAEAKSGPLFSLAVELPLIASGREHELPTARAATRSLALGYQLLDDATDAAPPAGAAVTEGVNAVHVLMARGHAFRAARQAVFALARARLLKSIRLADAMADGTGAPLRACGEGLCATLAGARKGRA